MLISEYRQGDNRRFITCNSLDKYGNTPLHYLISHCSAKDVHILTTRYGCTLHFKGAESKLLLHQLIAGGYATVLQELLINFNHDPASVDEDSNTLLHTAAQHGQYGIAEFQLVNC